MKAIKMLGLAALAALMAMAFVGASSAMGEATALCDHDVWLVEKVENEKGEIKEIPIKEDTCGAEHLVTHVHEVTLEGQKATLLNGISNVLCDVLFLGEVTSKGSLSELLNILLEEPDILLDYWMRLAIEGNFTYTNCVDEKPNACTVTEVSASSSIKFLREGHEQGPAVGEGEVKVVCSGISCTYNGKELEGTAKGPLLSNEANGEVSISEEAVNKVKGLLCPSTAKLDITLTPLEPTYIAS